MKIITNVNVKFWLTDRRTSKDSVIRRTFDGVARALARRRKPVMFAIDIMITDDPDQAGENISRSIFVTRCKSSKSFKRSGISLRPGTNFSHEEDLADAVMKLLSVGF